MSKRIVEFDYIRVAAISIVVLSHYFLFSSLNDGAGRFFAGLGNIVFFLLSSLLYGLKGLGDDKPIRFLTKRIIRLCASAWPFLIILIALYYLFNIDFSWFDAGLNFVLLGYLGKLPGNGHLWFLTVMMACYVECIFLGFKKTGPKWFSWCYLAVMIGVMIGLEMVGVPGNMFAILGLFAFVYANADSFMSWAKKINLLTALVIIAVNALVLWLCVGGLFEQSRIFYYLLTDLCGVFILAFLIRVFPEKQNSVIVFLSGISFEIYLVHHTLCQGPFIRIPTLPLPHIVKLLLVATISVFLAVPLHWIAEKFTQFLKKRILE